MASSPRRRIRLATVAKRINGSLHPVGPNEPPRSLTPATGARTTRFDRPRHCRSSRAPLSIAHEFDVALRSHAHTTSSRPPHPASTFVTIAIRPSVVEAGWREQTIDFGKTEEIFSPERPDSQNSVELLGKIRFCAHAS